MSRKFILQIESTDDPAADDRMSGADYAARVLIKAASKLVHGGSATHAVLQVHIDEDSNDPQTMLILRNL